MATDLASIIEDNLGATFSAAMVVYWKDYRSTKMIGYGYHLKLTDSDVSPLGFTYKQADVKAGNLFMCAIRGETTSSAEAQALVVNLRKELQRIMDVFNPDGNAEYSKLYMEETAMGRWKGGKDNRTFKIKLLASKNSEANY